MVGFYNRQSFYAAFYKYTGITPKQYKLDGGDADSAGNVD